MPDLSPVSDARKARRIYLDYHASTPCDPAVAALMRRFEAQEFANPASAHVAGQRAARSIEAAREQVAEAVGALPEEIIFSSGATESNNIAILGAAAAAQERGELRRRIVTLPIEHPSVLAPCGHLAKRGYEIALCPVHRDGRLDIGALEELVDETTLLVSIQAANNEIGTIQPLREVSEIAQQHGALLHSDAAQALGKLPLDFEALGFDLLSLSAHKCYGPKGIGALWLRGGPRGAPVAPLCFGGGHEQGLRPGTPNAAAIVGFGEAARLASERQPNDAQRLSALRDRFEALLLGKLGGITRNGALDNRLPGASSLTFEGVDADALIANLPEFDLSTASACHSGTPEPSHVLRALGLTQAQAYSTLRIAFGRPTTEEEVDRAVNHICDAVAHLRYNSSN